MEKNLQHGVMGQFLFCLDEDEQRKVYLFEDSGILHVESQLRLDDYRTYNRFVDSYKTRKGILEHLREKYHKAQAALYEKNISMLQRMSSVFLPYVPRIHHVGNFLDIGCNTGSLLANLSPSWKKYGVEINADAYEEAKKIDGVTVYNVCLENLETDVKFDFVRASHVIEHVQDYELFVHKIYNILKPGGRALIYTPNTNSLSYWLFRRHWSQFYDKTHVNLFNLKNLRDIFDKHGFETVDEGTYYMGTTASSMVCSLNLEPGSRGALFSFYFFLLALYPFSFLANALRLGGSLYICISKRTEELQPAASNRNRDRDRP